MFTKQKNGRKLLVMSMMTIKKRNKKRVSKLYKLLVLAKVSFQPEINYSKTSKHNN